MVTARDPTQRDTEATSALITIRSNLCVLCCERLTRPNLCLPRKCAMTSSRGPYVDRCVAVGAAATDHGSHLDFMIPSATKAELIMSGSGMKIAELIMSAGRMKTTVPTLSQTKVSAQSFSLDRVQH